MRVARAVHSQLKKIIKISFSYLVTMASGLSIGQSKDAFFFLGFSLVA